MLKRSWLPALVTTVFVTVGTGCGDECVDQFDCRDKGVPPAGQAYACVENKCELRTLTPVPEEDAGTTTDAGTDAGTTTDAGTGTDAGTDAGTTTDAGTDAGTTTDAGTSDAGTGPTACTPACDLTQACNIETNTCEASSVTTTPAETSAQVTAVITAAAGAQSPALPISGAFVTFVKPTVAGSTEAGGFFLQAEAAGPAVFVLGSASATSVAVGDRVTLNVTETEVTSGIRTVKAVTDLTVVSKNHGVWNLDTGTPPGLKVDVSTVSSFEDAGTTATYESRLVTVSGTVEAAAASGAGFTGFPLTTTGEASPSPLRLRVPDAVASELDLTTGCAVLVPTGIVWRFNAQPQVSVFAPSQLSVSSCPAPKLTGALAASATEVRLTFDRKLDATTVQATDFTLAPAAAISAATVTGAQVALTTDALTPTTPYTVTVNGEVKDTAGTVLNAAANSASFTSLTPPPAGAALVINEVDYDNVGADTAGLEYVEIYNRGNAAADLSDVLLLFVNGNSSATPRKEYLRFALSDVKDAAGNAATSLPAGGYLVAAPQPFFDTVTLPAGTLRLVIKGTSATTPNADVIENGVSDGIGLVQNATGILLDSVVYESGSLNTTFTIATAAGDKSLNFEEGTRTVAADSNAAVGSLQRVPNGNDTNNNNADFKFVGTLTPGAPTP
ncbi:lamin tail domain-containing protein [Corallococcus terminator]|nr:lamin tail domain-containing protein [Corallococcus terminator]